MLAYRSLRNAAFAAAALLACATAPAQEIFLDPATGAPRAPTPDEQAQIDAQRAAQRPAPAAVPQAFTTAEGVEGMHLNGAFDHYASVNATPDGQLAEHCAVPESKP